jgi:hypothetical protein
MIALSCFSKKIDIWHVENNQPTSLLLWRKEKDRFNDEHLLLPLSLLSHPFPRFHIGDQPYRQTPCWKSIKGMIIFVGRQAIVDKGINDNCRNKKCRNRFLSAIYATSYHLCKNQHEKRFIHFVKHEWTICNALLVALLLLTHFLLYHEVSFLFCTHISFSFPFCQEYQAFEV